VFVFFLVVLGARMVYTYWEKGKVEEKPKSLSTAMHVLIVLFGILVVPFMTYVCKYPTKMAAGSSHLIISFSALAGIIGHATSHRLDIPLIAVTGIVVLIGGNLGARISMRVKSRMIKAGLGLLMWALAAQLVVKLLGYL
jgi:hypothetical protein